ncbi:MAG: PAS domain-containing sensor histidine kinase [Bdellovibrio sp.]
MIFRNAKLFQADFKLSGEFTSNWTPVELSGPWEECFGWSIEELKKIPFYSLLHPEDLPLVLNSNYHRMEPGHLHSMQCRNQCKDGEYKPILWIFYMDPHNGRSHVFAQDLSACTTNEFLLEQSQIAAGVGSWALDIAKNKVYWTKGLYALHGLTPETFSPTAENTFTLYEDITPEMYYGLYEKMLVQDGLPEFELEAMAKKPDGSKIRVRIRSRVAKSDNIITHIYGSTQDITKETEREQALVAAKEDAEMANRIKSDFLTNISHEIRTPMNSIIGMLEVLSETNLDSDQRQYTDVLSRASGNLLRILNDVLDLAKIEAGKIQFESVAFNLHDVIKRTVDLFTLRAKEKNINLVVDIDDALRPVIMGDAIRVGQVLNNLVANAMKFTDQGSIVVRAELAPDNPDFVQISVKDSGIGIDSQAIPHLFKRFYQVDNSISRKYGGTGLGLSISKELIERMGGGIAADSKKGSGSIFRFWLPLIKS